MCGINGILRLSAAAPPIDPAELLRTRDAMARRTEVKEVLSELRQNMPAQE